MTKSLASARTKRGHEIGPPVTSRPFEKFTITFTGNRRNELFEIQVGSATVYLPLSSLKALIQLVMARAGAGHGFVQHRPVTIFRLRRALDESVGAGAGRTLIETGASDEYRLTIPRNELNRHVVLAPCFAELVQFNAVASNLISMLEENASNEIKKKS